MTARLITPPANLAVSIEAARASARVDGTELDSQLEDAIRSFTDEAEHLTGRAFINQTWRVTLSAFPAKIELPPAGLQSIESVKFYDTAGNQQTLDPQDYFADTVSEPGYVLPAPGKAWPATAARLNAVEVQYVVGYGQDHTSVPDGIKGYILARVAEQFLGMDRSEHVDRNLDRHKVYS